jgi:hypothetical protein
MYASVSTKKGGQKIQLNQSCQRNVTREELSVLLRF